MIFIPIPFVVALFLIVIMIQKVRRMENLSVSDWFFIALMSIYALQSVLIGLRWGYYILEVMPLQVVLAPLIATFAFLAFQSLTDNPHQTSPWQALHLIPALLIGLCLFINRELLGSLIPITFLAYGIALLIMAWRGPDILVKSRLDGVVLSYKALWITSIALFLSAISEVVINFAIEIMQEAYIGLIISGFNTLTLIMLGAAVAITGNNTETPEESVKTEQPTLAATSQHVEIANQVDDLITTKSLYKDAELNLSRLARRLSLPARQVSEAINRTHKMSVSQYVNNLRIAEACRLLENTDEPVTYLMLDAGFISKSNFNREFLRITGQSPTQWRQMRKTAG